MTTDWQLPTLGARAKTTVERFPYGEQEFPWLVWCHCRFTPVAKSPDWATAQRWAARHAAEHEASRCDKCGRLP